MNEKKMALMKKVLAARMKNRKHEKAESKKVEKKEPASEDNKYKFGRSKK